MHFSQCPNRSRESRRGSTLVLSLIAVVVVVALSAVFLQFTSSVSRRQGQAADQKRAFYMAEAGLGESFAAIRVGKSGIVGSEKAPAIFGNGLFWVDAEDTGDGYLKLTSTGMCGSAKAELDLVVLEGSSSVAALGMFSAGDLTITSGSLLDSFDSSAGAYGGGAGFGGARGGWLSLAMQGQKSRGGRGTGKRLKSYTPVLSGSRTLYEDVGNRGVARVSSNGDIVIEQAAGEVTRVLGDLRPGTGRTLTEIGGPEITGSIEQLTSNVILPPIEIPAFPPGAGLLHTGVAPRVIAPTDGALEFLSVGAGAHVTLTGPTILVLGDLVVDQGAELFFDTDSGPIEIYVTNTLDLRSGSFLSFSSESPADVVLQFSGVAPVTLAADGDFYGTIYAPLAEIQVETGFHMFGSLVGGSLTLNGACEVHFDIALGLAAQADALPALISWRVIDLQGNASPSGDPFADLGVDPTTLLSPDRAHPDQNLQVRYYEKAGPPAKEYNGLESGFDWSNVSQVIHIRRDGKNVGNIQGLAGIGGLGDGSGVVSAGEQIGSSDLSRCRMRRIDGN